MPAKKTKNIEISETKNGARDDGEVNDRKKDRWTEGLTDERTNTHKLKKKKRKKGRRTYIELFHPTALAAIRECL